MTELERLFDETLEQYSNALWDTVFMLRSRVAKLASALTEVEVYGTRHVMDDGLFKQITKANDVIFRFTKPSSNGYSGISENSRILQRTCPVFTRKNSYDLKQVQEVCEQWANILRCIHIEGLWTAIKYEMHSPNTNRKMGSYDFLVLFDKKKQYEPILPGNWGDSILEMVKLEETIVKMLGELNAQTVTTKVSDVLNKIQSRENELSQEDWEEAFSTLKQTMNVQTYEFKSIAIGLINTVMSELPKNTFN